MLADVLRRISTAAPPLFVGSHVYASGYAGGDHVSHVVPAATQAGDFLAVFVVTGNIAVAAPAGWTRTHARTGVLGGTFTRFADELDAGKTYEFTYNGDGSTWNPASALLVYRNASTVAEDASKSSSNAADITYPALTGSGPNDVVLRVLGWQNNYANPGDLPSDHVLRVDAANSTGGQSAAIRVHERIGRPADAVTVTNTVPGASTRTAHSTALAR